MSLSLPPPIALYVQLENAGETETLSACFAPNAIVHDEGRPYEGLAAITAWKAETKQKYHHTVTPLAVAQQHDKTVLTATLTGDFPGSPVTVYFDFVLEAGKIGGVPR
jgi:hypothetical protein